MGLDLLRFFAASVVVLFHFGLWQLEPSVGWLGGLANNPSERLRPFAHFGWVGVEIFFVISGYVIALSAEDTTRRRFAEARFLRLVPTVWICTPILLALHAFYEPASVLQLLPRFARSMLFDPFGRQMDDVYWTLGVEVSFYILIYLAVLPSFARRIEWLAAGLSSLSLGFWLACYAAESLTVEASSPWHHLLPEVLKIEEYRPLQLLLVPHGALFAIGIISWLCTEKGVTPQRIAIGAIALTASLLEIGAQNALHARAVENTMSPVPALALWLLAVAFLVLSVRLNARAHRTFANARHFVRRLGLLTFPLYLLHSAVGVALVVYLTEHGLVTGTALLCGVLAGAASAQAVEPLERLLRTRLQTLLRRI